MEHLLIKKIEGGIRAIRFGHASGSELSIGSWLAKLKPLNEGMYDELLSKYAEAVKKAL